MKVPCYELELLLRNSVLILHLNLSLKKKTEIKEKKQFGAHKTLDFHIFYNARLQCVY